MSVQPPQVYHAWVPANVVGIAEGRVSGIAFSKNYPVGVKRSARAGSQYRRIAMWLSNQGGCCIWYSAGVAQTCHGLLTQCVSLPF
jgi:hypothetical protein